MPKNRSIRSQTKSPLYFEHSDIFSQSLIKTLQFVGRKHERKNLVNLWLEPGFEQLLFAVSGIAEKTNFFVGFGLDPQNQTSGHSSSHLEVHLKTCFIKVSPK